MLRGSQEPFARCLAEKLLTYALGRGVEPYDRPAVDGIVNAAKARRLQVFDIRSGYRPQRPLPETLRQDNKE